MKKGNNKILKIGGALFGVFVLLGLMGAWDSTEDKQTDQQQVTETTENNVVETNHVDEEPNTPDEAVTEQKSIAIEVTSQIVKKVNGKCRYFFDIRNNDTESFSGDVFITLHKQSGAKLGQDTFSTNKPIEPTLGSSVTIDINTCPISQDGDLGIATYKYTVKADGKEVNTGEGAISEKYEDLSGF